MNQTTLKESKMLEELFTEQRTDEWHKQRMGKFTASRFGELMTNARKKDEVLGATAVSYIYEKAAELLTEERKEIFGAALDWGTENEPVCKAYFEETTGLTIEEMPFVDLSTITQVLLLTEWSTGNLSKSNARTIPATI
jgi:hypothetical protein